MQKLEALKYSASLAVDEFIREARGAPGSGAFASRALSRVRRASASAAKSQPRLRAQAQRSRCSAAIARHLTSSRFAAGAALLRGASPSAAVQAAVKRPAIAEARWRGGRDRCADSGNLGIARIRAAAGKSDGGAVSARMMRCQYRLHGRGRTPSRPRCLSSERPVAAVALSAKAVIHRAGILA